MNSKEAERLLKLLNDGLESGLDYAPVVVQQYLVWKRIEGVIVIAALVAGIVGLVCFARYARQKSTAEKTNEEARFAWTFVLACAATLSLFLCFGLVAAIVGYLSYWFAPDAMVTQWLMRCLR